MVAPDDPAEIMVQGVVRGKVTTKAMSDKGCPMVHSSQSSTARIRG